MLDWLIGGLFRSYAWLAAGALAALVLVMLIQDVAGEVREHRRSTPRRGRQHR